jgi:BlaI family transcriptional regulator, penicillinase repressor
MGAILDKQPLQQLSRRERQIVDSLYQMKEGSVESVRTAIPSPPSYSAVRSTMNILVRKGFIAYRRHGRKYVYFPVVSSGKARLSAVKHLLETYFDGSIQQTVSGLLTAERKRLTEIEYRELIELIEDARRRETGK